MAAMNVENVMAQALGALAIQLDHHARRSRARDDKPVFFIRRRAKRATAI
jgi:hypothetical protein